jgi:hypothetical protein
MNHYITVSMPRRTNPCAKTIPCFLRLFCCIAAALKLLVADCTEAMRQAIEDRFDANDKILSMALTSSYLSLSIYPLFSPSGPMGFPPYLLCLFNFLER